MNDLSLTVLDRLICYFATLGGDERRMADLLGQLKQLLLELSKGPAALPGARGQNLATPEDSVDAEEEPIFTRLGGRGIGQVWVWLCPDRVMRSGPRRKVTARARGRPGREFPSRGPSRQGRQEEQPHKGCTAPGETVPLRTRNRRRHRRNE